MKPQKKEDWEKEIKEFFKDRYAAQAFVLDFVRQLLSQEEANWMAEIHEQIKSEKEKLLKGIIKIIDELEESYRWGGGENEDGGLEPGCPDFEGAKKKLKEEIKKEL